jgi:DNA-binding LacI/PurR family transcriptional regulator
MIEVPKRTSLIDQVANVLRGSVHRKEWTEGLPPERTLCDRLQVSRLTLRAALKVLHREGLLRFSDNRRKRVPVRRMRAVSAAEPKLIVFLSAEPLYAHAPATIFKVHELRRHLQDAGYGLEFLNDPRLLGKNPSKVLEALVHQVRARCWVLHWANAAVQQWFAARQLRVVVMGSCHEGIRFPSADMDYRALARHAVGVFHRQGHRRLALIGPHRGLQGELAREQGFLEAAQNREHAGASPLILRHDGTLESIRSIVSARFCSRAVTAILAADAIHALSLMTCLTHAGLRLPDDISIISADEEWFLDHVAPTVARYRMDLGLYALRVSRMALRLAEKGDIPSRQVLIVPKFHPGESLAACLEPLSSTRLVHK